MTSRRRSAAAAVGALGIALGIFAPERADAQASERFRVMVTNLVPKDDADDDFGKDLAKELRELINEFATHQPVDEDDVEDAADDFDLDMEDLDCVVSMQLASQKNWPIVFCGSYAEDDEAKTFSLEGVQFATPGGSGFPIADKTWHEDDVETAAAEISGAFEEYVDMLRSATFCGDYFESKDWENAERQCTRVLEMDPDHVQVRYIYASLLRQTDRYEEAYEQSLEVILADPLHEQALQLAGYLAAQLDRKDEARGHYNQFLLLSPDNVPVRLNIAYDLATAGDPEGAMILVEEGLAIAPDDVQLLVPHAAYATRAAQDIKAAGPSENGDVAPEIAALYGKAIESYGRVYEAQGAEMESSNLRNMIAGHSELGQLDEAVQLAERVLETHGEDAALRSLYADVLRKADRTEEALAALEGLAALDPDYRNVAARMGSWLLEIGRADEALVHLTKAVENGEQTADAMTNLIFQNAYSQGVTPKNWAYALEMLERTSAFESEASGRVRGQVDFWYGYALYNQALELEKPQTLQSAQRTLPGFQRASQLFARPEVASYASAQSISLQQFKDATQQYIEIQEAIIQRGR